MTGRMNGHEQTMYRTLVDPNNKTNNKCAIYCLSIKKKRGGEMIKENADPQIRIFLYIHIDYT